MKYIVSGKEMKLLDETTSAYFKVPSVVLMEQAAIGFVRELVAYFPKNKKILFLCGKGNNGGDGIAASRLLNQQGYDSTVLFTAGDDSGSMLYNLQKEIYLKYAYPVTDEINPGYNVIVDAVFGTGLSKPVTGPIGELIDRVNSYKTKRIALDIATGVSSDTGGILGKAFKADVTITFSYEKKGQILWPGCENSGQVIIVPIGITDESMLDGKFSCGALDDKDLQGFLPRQAHSNKGTFGKVLCIAGSFNMSGAAVLCAGAAYRAGCGMVKVTGCSENREILQECVPEALIGTYNNIRADLKWADAVLIGPGIGKSQEIREILSIVLKECQVPLVLDADALNIVSEDMSLLENHKGSLVVTPHLGEMSRLTGKTIEDIQHSLIETALDFSKKYNLVCLLKDFRSITAYEGFAYINRTGNNGMATAGSGDVLAGIVASFLAQGESADRAAAMGAYIHGRAGDYAAGKNGLHALMASDIIDGLKIFWNKVE